MARQQKRKLPNLSIIEDLKNASLESFKQGHYLQSDLRFKAPIIKLYKDDISNLSVFLKGMMDKIRELKGVIPENKLYEDQTSIQTILIHYIVFQNRTKIHFYFPYRSGIGVQLTEDEVKNMLDVLNGVPAMAENIKNAITY